MQKQLKDLAISCFRLMKLIESGASEVEISACLADIKLVCSGEDYE